MLTLLCIYKMGLCFVSNNENFRNVPKGRCIWQVGPLGISQIIPPTHMASLGCHWILKEVFFSQVLKGGWESLLVETFSLKNNFSLMI